MKYVIIPQLAFGQSIFKRMVHVNEDNEKAGNRNPRSHSNGVSGGM